MKLFFPNALLDQHGPKLKNAEQVVNFLKANFSSCPKTQYSRNEHEVSQTFWNVTNFDIEVLRQVALDCEPIPWTRDVHNLLSVDAMHTNLLKKKLLSCFCYFC